MAGEQSSEAVQQAREALQKLNRDVATFRDPAVRRHFHAHHPSPSQSETTSQTPAQLQAAIISMRTELHEANEAHERVEKTLLESSKRAAKAEAEVEELKKQLKETNTEHDAVVKAASERIETLEKESKEAVEAARTKSYRLQEVLEKDRLGSSTVMAERDRYRSDAKAALSAASALERELDAVSERHRVEIQRMSREMQALQAKNVALEEEVNFLKDSLQSESSSKKDVSERRNYIQGLREEIFKLREQLAERDNKVVEIKKEFIEAESAVFDLNRELEEARHQMSNHRTLVSEVEGLRAQEKQHSAMSGHLSALVREKEELTHLIAKLSSTGDVQEGLRILKEASEKGTTLSSSQKGDAGATPLPQDVENLKRGHHAELSELKKTISDLKEQCTNYESKMQDAVLEAQQATTRYKRTETIRRILEHEKTFFKAALERIEAEFDKVGDPSSELVRLRDRCTASEKSAQQYESALKEMERTLEDYQKNVQQLSSELAIAKRTQSSALGPEQDNLKSRLSQTEKAMKAAIEARDAAMDNAKELSTRMRSIEQELEKLKLTREGNSDAVVTAEELDYDPSVLKVVHMKDNPLSLAIQRAAAEREVAKGKKRMRIEVEGLSPRGQVTNETIQALKKNIEELEAENAEISGKYKVGVRTVEIAKKRIEEVRSAVYNLFGWSMKILGAKYTITSIYADAPGDDLEFGRNEEGTMSLIETEYTKRLKDELEHYVQKMNSIPALLAHITMENFEKTTAFA